MPLCFLFKFNSLSLTFPNGNVPYISIQYTTVRTNFFTRTEATCSGTICCASLTHPINHGYTCTARNPFPPTILYSQLFFCLWLTESRNLMATLIIIITSNNQMISIPGSLSFVMSSAPAKKSAGDARCASQDPYTHGNVVP